MVQDDDQEPDDGDPVQRGGGVADGDMTAFIHKKPLTPEERELVSWFAVLNNRTVRKQALGLIRAIAEAYCVGPSPVSSVDTPSA